MSRRVCTIPVENGNDGQRLAPLPLVSIGMAPNVWKVGPKAIEYKEGWEMETSVSWDQVREVTDMIPKVNLSDATDVKECVERVLSNQEFVLFWKMQYKKAFHGKVAFVMPFENATSEKNEENNIDLILSTTIGSAAHVTWMSWWEVQYNNCVIPDTAFDNTKARLPYFMAYVLNLCVPVIASNKRRFEAQANPDTLWYSLLELEGLFLISKVGTIVFDKEKRRPGIAEILYAIGPAFSTAYDNWKKT